ncbi:MAG: M50 family metallopeptidase, partial [Kiritimatiellia bacterium]
MGTDFQIARVMGIPIRLHWSLLVFFPLIAMRFAARMAPLQNAWLWGLLLTGLLFISVALHELGHALAGLLLGARTRDILLLPIGGAARMEKMPRRPWQELLLALAGPLVSLMLAMGGWLAAGVFYHSWGLQNAGQILATAAWINFWLALFNLLPSFPMD